VLPPGPVAVAVIVLPSSVPLGLEKERTTKALLGVLLSLPVTVVLVEEVLAEERTGKFCRVLGPASASPGSLGVTPLLFSSIPRAPLVRPLEKMELRRTRLPIASVEEVTLTRTPCLLLKAMLLGGGRGGVGRWRSGQAGHERRDQYPGGQCLLGPRRLALLLLSHCLNHLSFRSFL
jgi:hypothetical protein